MSLYAELDVENASPSKMSLTQVRIRWLCDIAEFVIESNPTKIFGRQTPRIETSGSIGEYVARHIENYPPLIRQAKEMGIDIRGSDGQVSQFINQTVASNLERKYVVKNPNSRRYNLYGMPENLSRFVKKHKNSKFVNVAGLIGDLDLYVSPVTKKDEVSEKNFSIVIKGNVTKSNLSKFISLAVDNIENLSYTLEEK